MSDQSVDTIPNVITLDLEDIIYVIDGKEYIDANQAIAAMLIESTLLYNNTMYVNCSDVFAWGCSDAEDCTPADILPLYKMFLRDKSWGGAMWCMIQRKERPQGPVEESIRKGGKWDFDAFVKEHHLRPNVYDGINHIEATYKLECTNAWLVEQGLEPVPFNVHWWKAGWEPYYKAHPNWFKEDAHRVELQRRYNEWYRANGWEILIK